MNIKAYKPSAVLLTTLLTLGALPGFPVAAQNATGVNTNLTENLSYIRECRETNAPVEVFDNSDLSPVANRIGTLPANTQVTLTGVLAPGRAQIYLPSGNLSEIQPVGWISAANLKGCDTAPPPTARACFRADVALNVRSQPNARAAIIGVYEAGDVIYTLNDPPTLITSPTTFPDYGRVWMAVAINSTRGWIARTGRYGVGNNVTSIPCP